MSIEYVNQQLGWPCKNDPDSIQEFNRFLATILREYIPNPQVRGGYSFQLKHSGQEALVVKVLKSAD